jgi:hypothetical protein
MWSASRPDCFTTRETAPDTIWVGGWMGPRAVLRGGEEENTLPLPGIEIRSSGLYPSHYTVWATLGPYLFENKLRYFARSNRKIRLTVSHKAL